MSTAPIDEIVGRCGPGVADERILFLEKGAQYIKECRNSFCYHPKKYRNHYSENRSSGSVRGPPMR